MGNSATQQIPDRLYRKVYLSDEEGLKGNCSQGQLTVLGAEMHYMLGETFRQLYVEETPLIASVKDVYVRSTDITRTIQSAMSQMQALLKDDPSIRRLLGGSLDVSVLDIHVVEQSSDYLAPSPSCASLIQSCNQALGSTEWAAAAASMQALASYLRTQWQVQELPEWTVINDALYSRHFHNLPMPAGVNETVREAIHNVTSWQMGFLYQDAARQRLGIGRFLNLLLQNMLPVVTSQAPPAYPFRLFSAHDTSIGMIASALGVWSGRWPGFASHIRLELYQDTSSSSPAYFVEIAYYDQPPCVQADPIVVLMPFEQFKAAISGLLVSSLSEYTQLCSLDQSVQPAALIVAFLC